MLFCIKYSFTEAIIQSSNHSTKSFPPYNQSINQSILHPSNNHSNNQSFCQVIIFFNQSNILSCSKKIFFSFISVLKIKSHQRKQHSNLKSFSIWKRIVGMSSVKPFSVALFVIGHFITQPMDLPLEMVYLQGR